MHTPPSEFPLFDPDTLILHDGARVPACHFCREAIKKADSKCLQHYAALTKRPGGFYQCPFGFTSRIFRFLGKPWVITGVVAYPRFNTENERRQAKSFPETRASRASIDAAIKFFGSLEIAQADAIEQSTKILPQAFHELRKLNRAVLQHAERELAARRESTSLKSIVSAAELMRNNFDILEALSNIEGMRALPSDATINIYDLVYKIKKVLEERATEKRMHLWVSGARAIVRGSTKSFPIVPQVLLENAIKYGTPGSEVLAEVVATSDVARLTVTNRSDTFIDPEGCFERGARYAPDVEGGGFGLFLAREIVNCHAGTIYCEVDGKTVRMVVELPLVTVIS